MITVIDGANAPGDVRILNTREMEWRSPGAGEPFHGTQTRTKVLARAGEGWPCVQMLTRNGSSSSYGHGRPERHAHRTVREWVYILGGELPYREFNSPNDTAGTSLTYRQGYFLERVPGIRSWHGVDPSRDSFGYIGLEFRTGPGHAPGEAGNESENLSLPDGEVLHGDPIPDPPGHTGYPLEVRSGSGYPYSTAHVRVTDTHLTDWAKANQPEIAHGVPASRRTLAENQQGKVLFEEVLISAANATGTARTITERECWMVLGGDATLDTANGVVSVKKHDFLDWTPGTTLRFDADNGSTPYLHVLVWHIGRTLRATT